MKMGIIPWRLKRLLTKYFGSKSSFGGQRFQPDFSYHAQGGGGSGAGQSIGDRLGRQLLLPNHPFLISAVEEVKDFAEQESLQNFRSELLQCANLLCDKTFPVYCENLPPLKNGFSWPELEKLRPDDVLYRVRPHRFEFAPILSLAALYDERFLEPLHVVIKEWMRHARTSKSHLPYLTNLVVIYRVVALTWSCCFLAANKTGDTSAPSNELLTNTLLILKEDIRFLKSRLGKSHPNNHLLADYFAGWFISFFYPEFVEADDFSGYESKWIAELKRQFYSDGGNFEHSLHYHELGCEMAVIYILAKQVREQSVAPEIESFVEKMLAFQASLTGSENKSWPIGDTTEDPLFPLASVRGGSLGLLVSIHQKLFQRRGSELSDADRLKQAKNLLLGFECPEDILNAEDDTAKINFFPEAGYHIFSESGASLRYIFRTGVAPGSQFMPGHMQSDCLSLYWRSQEENLLAASGTFTYRHANRNGLNLRQFFCSPMAHSCFVIKDEDSLGEMTGDFRDSDNGLRVSSRAYGTPEIGSWCEGKLVSSNHYNGYKRGVVHLTGGITLVYDLVPIQISHSTKGFGWQVAPRVTVSKLNRNVVALKGAGSSASIVPAHNLQEVHLSQGDSTAPLGWVSEGYGVMEAAPNCYYPFDGEAGLTGFMLLNGEPDENASLDLDMCSDSTICATAKVGEKTYTLLLCLESQPILDLPNLPEFSGRLLVIESFEGRLIKIKGLGVNRIRWALHEIDYESDISGRDLEMNFSNGKVLIRYFS